MVPINLYSCGSLNLTSFKPLKITFAKDLAATSFPGSSSTRPPERERGRGKSRWGPWERGWYSWCPYYWGVRNIQRKSLGESWPNICKFKSDLMLTVMSFVSVRVLITPDSKCFTAVSVRTDGAELKKRKLVNQNPLQVVVPIIDTGWRKVTVEITIFPFSLFSFIAFWNSQLPWKRQYFEDGHLEVSMSWPRKYFEWKIIIGFGFCYVASPNNCYVSTSDPKG